MGRRFVICLSFCVAVALPFHTAAAGDRKSSAARRGEAAAGVTVRHYAQAVASAEELSANGAVRATRRSALYDDAASREEENSSANGRRERVTLFRFNTGLGEVAVHPVFGAAKGAQFSLGF